jgi:hypothetical protein
MVAIVAVPYARHSVREPGLLRDAAGQCGLHGRYCRGNAAAGVDSLGDK